MVPKISSGFRYAPPPVHRQARRALEDRETGQRTALVADEGDEAAALRNRCLADVPVAPAPAPPRDEPLPSPSVRPSRSGPAEGREGGGHATGRLPPDRRQPVGFHRRFGRLLFLRVVGIPLSAAPGGRPRGPPATPWTASPPSGSVRRATGPRRGRQVGVRKGPKGARPLPQRFDPSRRMLLRGCAVLGNIHGSRWQERCIAGALLDNAI